MRLTSQQHIAIAQVIAEVFGPQTRVFLFGSRTDASKRGGDIDLLVEVSPDILDRTAKAINAIGHIQRRIGEQKIDLVFADGTPDTEQLLVVKNARREGILL